MRRGWVCYDFNLHSHLIPYSKLSPDPEQKVKVYIRCKRCGISGELYVFDRNRFEEWFGEKYYYDNQVEEPEHIEYIE